jgi:hypothetical protein
VRPPVETTTTSTEPSVGRGGRGAVAEPAADVEQRQDAIPVPDGIAAGAAFDGRPVGLLEPGDAGQRDSEPCPRAGGDDQERRRDRRAVAPAGFLPGTAFGFGQGPLDMSPLRDARDVEDQRDVSVAQDRGPGVTAQRFQ